MSNNQNDKAEPTQNTNDPSKEDSRSGPLVIPSTPIIIVGGVYGGGDPILIRTLGELEIIPYDEEQGDKYHQYKLHGYDISRVLITGDITLDKPCPHKHCDLTIFDE